MATLFSPEFVTLLTPIFVFIFVFAGVYALLLKTKWFSDKQMFNLIIAFATAMLIFFVPEAHIVIASFTPWMGLFTILLLFVSAR